MKWFKFVHPSSKPMITETSTLTPVHVAYSPIAFMNHQWTIKLHDGYPLSHVLLPDEYILPSLPTLCNLKFTMFHFGVDLLHSTTEPQHDLPSLASPKGKMAISFSWTTFFKSPLSLLMMCGLRLSPWKSSTQEYSSILSSIMQVLPIGMLPILSSMMQCILGHFNLEFVKD